MRYLNLIFLSFIFIFSSAFAQETADSKKLLKAKADRMAWKPVTYKGNNQVEICDKQINQSKCRNIDLPDNIGQVKGIVYGVSNELPQSWLTFSNGQINLCVEDEQKIKCTFVTYDKQENVKISYDTSTRYSSLVYLSVPNNQVFVGKVVENLNESIKEAAENIKSNNIIQNRMTCVDCENTPNLEDPGSIPTVYVTGTFPAISVVDGGMQQISVSFLDETIGLPDPMPDGVSPADILKAKDPKRMAACTAAWYRVYISMTLDCSVWIPGNYSAWSSCMRKSMDAYVINLKEDCYANYY